MMLFLVPTGMLTLGSHQSSTPVMLFLAWALILYALDLANLRDFIPWTLWLGVPILTLTQGWFFLLDEGRDDSVDSGYDILQMIFQTTNQGVFWVCAACLLMLQFPWFIGTEIQQQQQPPPKPSTMARQCETILHTAATFVVPTLSQCCLTTLLEPWHGRDVVATGAPHLYAGLLLLTMLGLGSCRSSFPVHPISSSSPKDHHRGLHHEHSPEFSIPSRIANAHVSCLLLVPPTMHLAMFRRRIFSSYSGLDDWCDWILSFTIPYLLVVLVRVLHENDIVPTPYGTLNIVSGGSKVGVQGSIMSTSTMLPSVVALVTSLAAQHRYLIPVAHTISYVYTGNKPPTGWLTLYWTLATVMLIAMIWLWGRKSHITNEPLLGEYQEDAIQLLLAGVGMMIGKGLGMSWNFTPLPILAFLGIALWLSTRMLRYLAIVLFVVHAAAFLVFTYRFTGIDQKMELLFPQESIPLVYFGMIVIATSALIGLVAGLAIRASGGLMQSTLKRFDCTGIILVLYTLVLAQLEISLLKNETLTGTKVTGIYNSTDPEIHLALYSMGYVVLTSAVIVGVALFMRHVRMTKQLSTCVVVSLAIGKGFAAYVDFLHSDFDGRDQNATDVYSMGIASCLAILLLATPYAFIQPVHLKSASHKRSVKGNEPELPGNARWIMMSYAFIFAPLGAALALLSIVEPLLDCWLTGVELGVGTSLSLLFGICVSIWGLAYLNMLNHLLPDGGGEFWKKTSGVAFLFGVLLVITAPSYGPGDPGRFSSWNPYRYYAQGQGGSDTLHRIRTRTGGLGVLLACIATMLAIAGPLHLKERRSNTGVKDRFLLLRNMIFSLMFGGGLAWFVIVQIMSEADLLYLICSAVSCLIIAFLGTVIGVIGYFINIENFDEIDEISKLLIFALPILMAVAALPRIIGFILDVNIPQGGGSSWLSAYFIVAGLTLFATSLAFRLRTSKDTRTRGLCNVFSVLSWSFLTADLYLRYGVGGLDENHQVTKFFGLAAPVWGTYAASLVLLTMEGESSGKAAAKTMRGSGIRTNPPTFLSLPLHQLRHSNKYIPLFAGTNLVFLVASLYVVLFRGSWLFTSSGSKEDAFSDVFSRSIPGDTNQNLAILVEQTVRNSQILLTSSQIDSAGIWTAKSFTGPFRHLLGIMAILPSIYHSLQRWWFRSDRQALSGVDMAITHHAVIPTNLLLITTCLAGLPIVTSWGLPCLQAAAFSSFLVGGLHILGNQPA